MRHGKKIHKLERPRAHRQALISNLATALITHGKIRTTEAKAKALKPVIDKLITTAKANTVHARRLAGKTIKCKETLKKLFDEVAPKMLNRTSGYSRVMRIGARRGDGAQVVLIELLSVEHKTEEKGKKGRKGWRKFGRRTKDERDAKAAVAPADEKQTEETPEETSPEERAQDAEAAAEKPSGETTEEVVEGEKPDSTKDEDSGSEKKEPE